MGGLGDSRGGAPAIPTGSTGRTGGQGLGRPEAKAQAPVSMVPPLLGTGEVKEGVSRMEGVRSFRGRVLGEAGTNIA